MEHLRIAIRQNCLLLDSLKNHPSRLRTLDVPDAVIPRLSHDTRKWGVALQRHFSGDSRQTICNAICVTINLLKDLVDVDPIFVKEMLQLDLEDGLDSMGKFYVDDVNVQLTASSGRSLLKRVRSSVQTDRNNRKKWEDERNHREENG